MDLFLVRSFIRAVKVHESAVISHDRSIFVINCDADESKYSSAFFSTLKHFRQSYALSLEKLT